MIIIIMRITQLRMEKLDMLMAKMVMSNIPTGYSPGRYNNGGVFCVASNGTIDDSVSNANSYGSLFFQVFLQRNN